MLLADPVNRQSKWDLLPLLPIGREPKYKRWRRTRTRASPLEIFKVEKKKKKGDFLVNQLCELLTTSFAYDVWSVLDPSGWSFGMRQPLKWIPRRKLESSSSSQRPEFWKTCRHNCFRLACPASYQLDAVGLYNPSNEWLGSGSRKQMRLSAV